MKSIDKYIKNKIITHGSIAIDQYMTLLQQISFSKNNKAHNSIGKKGNFHCEQAVEFLKLHLFEENMILLGNRGDRFPEDVGWWRGDYIISFLSPWIIPKYLLDRAKITSINL